MTAMTTRFEFATATRIIFGAGTVREAGTLAKELGQRALVVTGRTPARAASLLESLSAAGIQTEVFAIPGEPTLEIVRQGVEQARRFGCNMVIGCGGGSALDAGKAIAALLAHDGDVLDYLEIIGRGQPLIHPSLPYVAIPTTAGTGTEVTRNAVLSSPQHHLKVSLRSPFMLPRIALVDPELTHDLPGDVTASTGLDALTQLMEAFVSNRANPMTDVFCRDGIQRVARSLRRAYENGGDVTARGDMALGSLYGGLALANARLGAAHGFAAAIGGAFAAPHGAICARLLPFCMEANVRALRERGQGDAQKEALQRHDEVARILTGQGNATAEDGIAWVQASCRDVNVRPLAAYGITEADFPSLIAKAAASSSMQGNPVLLTVGEMQEILSRSCE